MWSSWSAFNASKECSTPDSPNPCVTTISLPNEYSSFLATELPITTSKTSKNATSLFIFAENSISFLFPNFIFLK